MSSTAKMRWVQRLVSTLTSAVLLLSATGAFAQSNYEWVIERDWNSRYAIDGFDYSYGAIAEPYGYSGSTSVNGMPVTMHVVSEKEQGPKMHSGSIPRAWLKNGQNDFYFDSVYYNGVECNGSTHIPCSIELSEDITSRLVRPGRPPLILFSACVGVYCPDGNSSIGGTDGKRFHTTVNLDLSTAGEDPDVAQFIAELMKAIADAYGYLAEHTAPEAENALSRMQELDQLAHDVNDLLNKPIEDITDAELDALATKYAHVSTSVTDQLIPLLLLLKSKLEDLREQLIASSQEVDGRVSGLQGPLWPGTNADPDAFDGFGPAADTGSIPGVTIPAFGTNPWDSTHDPYDAYAKDTIAKLNALISGGQVTDRNAFVLVYAQWRDNQERFERLLQNTSGVSNAEYSAYIEAKRKVVDVVSVYVDSRGWFKDIRVPDYFKDLIDFSFVYWSKARAEAMRLELNQWTGTLNEKQLAILDLLLMIDALHSSALAAADQHEATTIAAKVEKLFDGLLPYAKDAAILAVSFTPVGDFLDACVAATGWENCNPLGARVSRTTRILAAAGIFVIGSYQFIRKASERMGETKRVLNEVEEMFQDLKPRTPKTGIVKTIPSRPNPGGVDTIFIHEKGWQVKFNSKGFPDFTPYLHQGAPNGPTQKIVLTGDRLLDEAAANAKAGLSATPDGYSWHHNEDLGVMQLIRTDVHKAFAHNGGFAIYRRVKDGVWTVVDGD